MHKNLLVALPRAWRKLGNIELVDFWNDHWLGNTRLSMVYPNLYVVCNYRSISVAGAGAWDSDFWSWKPPWDALG